MTAKKREQAVRTLKRAGLAAIVATAILATPALAQRRGDCIRVIVDAPVILPDGSTHEAQALRLCFNQALNPSTGLHAIQVNGVAIGMAMSRIGKSEENASMDPIAVFERAVKGELRLIGYAVPAGKRMKTYTLRDFGKKKDERLRAKREPLDESKERDDVIVLAARLTR